MVEKFIIKIVADNNKGVMARIATLLARKGYNISSICVGSHLEPGEAGITLAINGSEGEVEQATKQLARLVNVISIKALHKSDVAEREHCLVKVKAGSGVKEKLGGSGAKVVQEGQGFVILEIVDYPAKVEEFVELAKKQFEIIDISRAGENAI